MAVVLVGALAVTTGCGQSGSSRPTDPASAPPTPTRSSHNARPPSRELAVFPRTIRAVRMRRDYIRLPVSSADLRQVINVHHHILAALADQGAFFGQVYPALSTNDGASWRIDGPQFAHAGACGVCTTNRLVSTRDRTLVAWGHGGNFVKTTTDLGRLWYQADFPGVESAAVSGHRLVVRALGDRLADGRFQTRRYVSTDDGRLWRRGRELPTVHD